ncbi:MAG: DUF2683 family protein [Candidatus Woesearchaeota archaeon]
MVQALLDISENTNRVINIVKAKHGFKDKNEAIEFIISEFIEYQNEPELRPEFIQKMKEIEKQPTIVVADFAKRYGL